MINRPLLLVFLLVMQSLHILPLQADIFRWDNGEVISGTEGVEPGPGVQLERLALVKANLSGLDLSDANLARSDLTDATLQRSMLTNADFAGASVTGAYLGGATAYGFTKEQLYSTASYQSRNLQQIRLWNNNLNGWDFGGQNLSGAQFSGFGVHGAGADLTKADLTGANLSNAILSRVTLTDADLTGAIVEGGTMRDITSHGFTKEQLYSTASYQMRKLQNVAFGNNDLTDWSFDGQDLRNTSFSSATLTNADFTAAIVNGAYFDAGSQGLTSDQLYSTQNYRSNDLQGIVLGGDLTDWDLSGQDLTEAIFSFTTLSGVDLTDAVIVGAALHGATDAGFTQEQLYSTASYKAKDLRGIMMGSTAVIGNDLAGWDLSGQDLTNASLTSSNLTNVNLSGANLKGALLAGGGGLHTANFDSTTVYDQWTVFPHDFDPIASGLSFVSSDRGDFNSDSSLDVTDVDILSNRIHGRFKGLSTRFFPLYKSWLEPMFDLNGDSSINEQDRQVWIVELKQTWFGDTNLDGEFNSGDLVDIFEAGEYEDGIRQNSGWAEGDWNGDGDFDTSDLVTAFTDGGYEQGPRSEMNAVPEPSGLGMMTTALALITISSTRGRGRRF